MILEDRFKVASEINNLWRRHVEFGEDPPDCQTIANIISRYDFTSEGNLSLVDFVDVDSAGGEVSEHSHSDLGRNL